MFDNNKHSSPREMNDDSARKIAESYLQKVYSTDNTYSLDPDTYYFVKEQDMWVFPLKYTSTNTDSGYAIKVRSDGEIEHGE